MRFILYIVAALFAIAQAGTLHGCAGTCIGNGIAASKCASSNSDCICSSETFLDTISSCVAATCSKEDQNTALSFAQEFCNKIDLAKRDPKKKKITQTLTKTKVATKTQTHVFTKKNGQTVTLTRTKTKTQVKTIGASTATPTQTVI